MQPVQPMQNHATGHPADAEGIDFGGVLGRPVGGLGESAYQGHTLQSTNLGTGQKYRQTLRGESIQPRQSEPLPDQRLIITVVTIIVRPY